MSLFSEYLKEREGLECFVLEHEGFMTFKVQGNYGEEFYIRDMYVSPDYRRRGIAREMADQVFKIAKDRGCKYVAGTLYTGANGNTESLSAMLSYGFRIHSWDASRIVLKKDLD